MAALALPGQKDSAKSRANMVLSSAGDSRHAIQWRSASTDRSGKPHLLLLLQAFLTSSCASRRKRDGSSCVHGSHGGRGQEGMMRRVPRVRAALLHVHLLLRALRLHMQSNALCQLHSTVA